MRNHCVVLNKIGDVIHPTSCFPLIKCENTLVKSEDSINKLPDDVLSLILSLLTMKEAARSSVLCGRWKNLWTFTTRSLEFDGSQMVYEVIFKIGGRSLEVERRRFVDWVNNVLRLYQGPTVDKFIVCFDLDEKISKCDMDSWVNFALEKKVKWLELDFTSSHTLFTNGTYILTTQFLRNYCLDSLTAVILHFVEVTGEVLQHIFSNCPFLEVLCVGTSKSLVNLKVPGPALRLKYLEIQCCHSIEHMDISGINLVSFKYCGPEVSILVKDVPCLVEASLAGHFACFLVDYPFLFSTYLSCLEVFELNVVCKNYMRFPRFPKLQNLKQLDLWLSTNGVDSLLFCTSLIKASPILHKFTLKLIGGLDDAEAHKRGKVKAQKVKRPHQCLKVLEIVGFVGCTIDFEFVIHILNIVESLEKIIIDPHLPYMLRKCKFEDTDAESEVRIRARKLETILPPGVELVIL